MRHFLFLVFLLLCVSEVFPNWQRSVTNYTRQTYKAANQNWMVAQHENGWMYFANNKGLLEYDGTSWNTYSIHNAKTRAIKCGNDGRIYVGGLRQFGYFNPNKFGGLDYICLSDSLKDERPGNMWNIQIADDRVYFQADRHITYLENDSIKQINYGLGIMHSAIINNKFYIATWEGLMILNGNTLTPLPNTQEASRSKIVGLYPLNNNILIVTSQHGLYLYDGIHTTKYETPADGFLHSNQLFCTAMKDSLLALGSVQDGVLLFNVSNNETEKISIHNGLQNKTVLSMEFDRENNLWLGLDNGIDCVNLNSPMYFLYSNRTAIGSGYTSNYYNGKLYLGTNQGLYTTSYPPSLHKEVNPVLVPGTEGQVWSSTKYDDKLFCAGSNSLIVIDGEERSRISGIRGIWWIKTISYHPDVLLAGTYTGIFLLKKNGNKWELSHMLEGGGYSPKSMHIEKVSNAIWVANKEHGLHRLTLSPDLKSVTGKNYNNQELPIGNNVYVSGIDDEIVIASREGLFRYNQIKDCLERYTRLEELLDGRTSYTYILQDEYGDIWYVADGILKLARYNAETKNYHKDESETYLKDFLIEDFEHIQTFDNNQAIIGTEEGFSLLQFDKNTTKKYPLNLQIRKVYLTIGKDSLIYGRSYAYNDVPLVISYKNNSMRIEYSVNNYDKSISTLYSYRLEGDANDAWSEYNENTTKEYTNLKEGKYTFHVKIITSQDKDPITTSFDFEILPPWYRTWWSYMIYALAFIGFLFYAYYQLSKTQKRAIAQKEREILKQKKQNELKDQKIDSLKEEKLQADLTHKSDELIRTTLNIVRKNEMLQEIKKEAVGISHSITEENLPNIRRKMLRLISHIDTNIEHDEDLRSFETSFDSLHHHFFEKLEQRFPELNKKEKLMCAYIRMDLMSKEIAPLMNISVRGVEIGRYRLRKKLQLTSDDNLADFLQKI
ncbi:triple tyrosine motif-containing protein [Bacteroides sp. 51]|uniref:triple tyrosine motif-containing protein n=1 Tax=Bacteroides sp. 51 TaxID=2302938 RepID=UPI0013D326A7|nr:triple tyrosine motif-containing protein [Bacteroides sp. 51]NDV80485.1 transcriptional regulator [Bacteroides sp. 51]